MDSFSKMGLFPKAEKTAAQIAEEIRIKGATQATAEKAQGTREQELVARAEETKRKSLEIKPGVQRILDDAQTLAQEAEKTANELDLLSRDLDRQGFKGGVVSSISVFLKEALGTQGEAEALRRKFRGIRASQAIKNLPPGVASDKDIELALSGSPPQNAPAAVVASWLRGASKMARIEQAFNEFKSGYVSENKNTGGLIKAWKANRIDLIGKALEGASGSVTGQEEAQEQDIVVNPSTGQRLQLTNGQWVPIAPAP